MLSCQHLLFMSQNVNNRLHLSKGAKILKLHKIFRKKVAADAKFLPFF